MNIIEQIDFLCIETEIDLISETLSASQKMGIASGIDVGLSAVASHLTGSTIVASPVSAAYGLYRHLTSPKHYSKIIDKIKTKIIQYKHFGKDTRDLEQKLKMYELKYKMASKKYDDELKRSMGD